MHSNTSSKRPSAQISSSCSSKSSVPPLHVDIPGKEKAEVIIVDSDEEDSKSIHKRKKKDFIPPSPVSMPEEYGEELLPSSASHAQPPIQLAPNDSSHCIKPRKPKRPQKAQESSLSASDGSLSASLPNSAATSMSLDSGLSIPSSAPFSASSSPHALSIPPTQPPPPPEPVQLPELVDDSCAMPTMIDNSFEYEQDMPLAPEPVPIVPPNFDYYDAPVPLAAAAAPPVFQDRSPSYADLKTPPRLDRSDMMSPGTPILFNQEQQRQHQLLVQTPASRHHSEPLLPSKNPITPQSVSKLTAAKNCKQHATFPAPIPRTPLPQAAAASFSSPTTAFLQPVVSPTPVPMTLASNRKKVAEQLGKAIPTIEEVKNAMKLESFPKIHVDPFSLAAFGIPPQIAEKFNEAGVTGLYPWQRDCLRTTGALDGNNLVYCAPTSGGKTLVAEIMMILNLIKHQSKRILFIEPYVSIVTEKTAYFKKLLAPNGYKVRGYYANAPPPDWDQKDDVENVAVCTYEKANALINSTLQECQTLDTHFSTVICDELHMLNAERRGALLETLLTKVRVAAPSVQIIGFSSALKNHEEICKWLNAHFYRAAADSRPVPLVEYACYGGKLYEGHFFNSETCRVIEVLQTNNLGVTESAAFVKLVKECTVESHSVLVVCSAKVKTEKSADVIWRSLFRAESKYIGLYSRYVRNEQLTDEGKMARSAREERIKSAFAHSSNHMNPDLKKYFLDGIAFHHASLSLEERKLVEDAYRDKLIFVICCTSTLTTGVNLPARRVIIRSIQGPAGGIMSVSEYRQAVGRAGRSGLDTAGESILMVDYDPEFVYDQKKKTRVPNLNRYHKANAIKIMTADAQAVISDYCKHPDSINRALLEAVATGIACKETEVFSFVQSMLVGSQASRAELDAMTEKALRQLRQLESGKDGLEKEGVNSLITRSHDPITNGAHYKATRIGEATLTSDFAPEDALRFTKDIHKAQQNLYLFRPTHLLWLLISPNNTFKVSINAAKLHELKQIADELKHKASSQVGEDPDLVFLERIRVTPIDFANYSERDYAEGEMDGACSRAYAAMALADLIEAMSFSEVSRKYGIPPGDLQKLQEAVSHSAGCAYRFSKHFGWQDMAGLLHSFEVRVAKGVKPELIDLMVIHSLNAAKAQNLWNAGLRTPFEISLLEDESQILEILRRTRSHSVSAPIEQEADERLARKILREAWLWCKNNAAEAQAQARAAQRKATGYSNVAPSFPLAALGHAAAAASSSRSHSTQRHPSQAANFGRSHSTQRLPSQFPSSTPSFSSPGQFSYSQSKYHKKEDSKPDSDQRPRMPASSSSASALTPHSARKTGFNHRAPPSFSSPFPTKHAAPLPFSSSSSSALKPVKSSDTPLVINKISSPNAPPPSPSTQLRHYSPFAIHSSAEGKEIEIAAGPTSRKIVFHSIADKPLSPRFPPFGEELSVWRVENADELIGFAHQWNQRSRFAFIWHLDKRAGELIVPEIGMPIRCRPDILGYTVIFCDPFVDTLEDSLVDEAVYVPLTLDSAANVDMLKDRVALANRALSRPDAVVVTWDARLQLRTCFEVGINPECNWMDPAVASWLLDPCDLTKGEKDLQAILKSSPLSVAIINKGSQGPGAEEWRNCARHLWQTLCAANVSEIRLYAQMFGSPTTVYPIIDPSPLFVMPILYALSKMESRGIAVNVSEARRVAAAVEKKIVAVKSQLQALTKSKCGYAIRGFNSHKEINNFLYKRMNAEPISVSDANSMAVVPLEEVDDDEDDDSDQEEGGKQDKYAKYKTKSNKTEKTTRSVVLHKLAEKYHTIPGSEHIATFCELIIEHRSLSKLQSTYLQAISQATKFDSVTETARVFPRNSSVASATGRISVFSPPLQSMPHPRTYSDGFKLALRKLFIPTSSDYVFLSADYSQIEARLMARLSGDTKLQRALQLQDAEGGLDFFESLAVEVLSVKSGEKPSEDERNVAKSAFYLTAYGGGAHALSANTGKPLDQCLFFMRDFREKFHCLFSYMDSVKANAQHSGYVQTVLGRRRYLPDIKNNCDEKKKQANFRKAVNTRIQGSAADIIMMAMIHISRDIQADPELRQHAFLVLQIHDELLFEVRKDYLPQLAQLVRKHMEETALKDIDEKYKGLTLPVRFKTSSVSWDKQDMQLYPPQM